VSALFLSLFNLANGVDIGQRGSSVEARSHPVGGATLVAETPPRPSGKQSWTSTDSDDGILESPELVYLGSRSAGKVVPETPIKQRQTRRR
jgi:hypothetical protein